VNRTKPSRGQTGTLQFRACETWYASATAAAAGIADGTVSYSFDVEGNMLSAANLICSAKVATYNYRTQLSRKSVLSRSASSEFRIACRIVDAALATC